VNTATDGLVVNYDAGPAGERVDRWKRLVRGRVISLGITVVVLIIIFVWQRERFLDDPAPMLVVYGLVLLAGIAWLVGVWLGYRATKRNAASVQQGVVLQVNRYGVAVAGQQIAWSDVSSLAVAKGRWPGGPLLQATRVDGSSASVPLEQIPVLPATLDSAFRAYSAGRHGLDLSALDI
jgi:hypothetical protein